MTVHDIRDIPADVDVSIDVCVVGSGPAGMTVARELAAAGRRVTVLESGDTAGAGEAGDLSTIESVGAPRVMDQTLVRDRGLGGTSRVWSGRLATFDEQDFRTRSWIPNSGWPLRRDELSQYFPRSADILGGPVADNNARSPHADRALGVVPAFDPASFTPYFWTYSSDPDRPGDFLWFGRDADRCRRSDIEFVVNATMTQLVPDPVGGAIVAVEVAGPDGRTRTFVPDVVVLCAGGIENPRLLLSSNRVHAAGVGNQHDQVGRYMMDHPRGPVGSWAGPGGDQVAHLFANVQLASSGRISRRRTATVGVALSPELQEAEELLNCSLWAVPQRSPDDALSSLLSAAGQRSVPSVLGHLARAAKGAPGIAQGLLDTGVRHRSPRRMLDRLDLYCMVEQVPDPLSRITLSARRDRLGVPITNVDWKIGAAEARTVRRAAELFSSEMARQGRPVPDLDDMIADVSAPFHFPDIAHPTGTTRMSGDPRRGVVDHNCRVHGFANLYVAGSSVFPTSGHANPTQMIVAMALRLADFLVRTHGPRAIATSGVRPVTGTASAPAAGQQVLVTGAGGKVGRLLLTRLVEDGCRVRALTSRPDEGTTDRDASAVEWVTCDLAASTPLQFDELLDGVDAVVHLAAVQHGDTVQAVNVDATTELFEACERVGVRLFCHLSSISVYGSPRVRSTSAEDAPTLDARSPVRRQYWTNPELQAYGRSKVEAEEEIRARQKGITRCVVFRPTIIVDSADVEARRAAIRRGAALNPRALHLVHNDDVVGAICWALKRDAATFELFNLADNDASCRHDSDVKALLYGDRVRGGAPAGRVLQGLYWLSSFAKFYRGGPLRLPLGLASYPSDKLASEGFSFTRGMRKAWVGAESRDHVVAGVESSPTLRGNPLLKSADWWAGVPAVHFAAVRRLGRRAAVPQSPARIVVLKTAAIGDTVLLSGAVRDLRRAYPTATITLAVGASNAQVARLVPDADAVVRVALGPSGVRVLRRMRPDLLIDFGSWPRIDALMAALSSASCVVGFRTEGQRRHAAFDVAIRHRPDVHELDNYRALVRAIGVDAGAEPRLALPETDAPPSQPPFAVAHLWPGGARSELREWPQARWSELVSTLRDAGLDVVVTGAPSDGPRVEDFLARTARAGVRSAYGMDFAATAALLARSSLVVSVNTGVMHAAAALGVPVVGLCGPTSAERWGPVGERAAAVSSRLPGCGFLNLGFEYDGNRDDCMAGIALDDVLDAAERVSGLSLR